PRRASDLGTEALPGAEHALRALGAGRLRGGEPGVVEAVAAAGGGDHLVVVLLVQPCHVAAHAAGGDAEPPGQVRGAERLPARLRERVQHAPAGDVPRVAAHSSHDDVPVLSSAMRRVMPSTSASSSTRAKSVVSTSSTGPRANSP